VRRVLDFVVLLALSAGLIWAGWTGLRFRLLRGSFLTILARAPFVLFLLVGIAVLVATLMIAMAQYANREGRE
jgi:hypothetical protein